MSNLESFWEDNSGDDLFEGIRIEPEDVVGEDRIESPFDPTQIRVDSRTLTIDLVLTRIREREIDLTPDFQRKPGIWKDDAQSRLIESALIRIPLPAFYMDATDDERWVVIDGLQRLTAFQRFVGEKNLKLTGLEFLSNLKGKGYEELSRSFQRRILETQITVYVITKGTPDKVKFAIFRRINTGGMPLSSQEIRHALNQGKPTRLLSQLASHKDFKGSIGKGVPSDRMQDQELILRFFAFTITSYKDYPRGDFDEFLNNIMEKINTMPDEDIEKLKTGFLNTMVWCKKIFGNNAFRKQFKNKQRIQPINKPLFESWSVNIYKLSDNERKQLYTQREALNILFIDLIENDRQFFNSISQGTGDVNKVKYRFEAIEKLIEKVIS